jgi:hypothetical protein
MRVNLLNPTSRVNLIPIRTVKMDNQRENLGMETEMVVARALAKTPITLREVRAGMTLAVIIPVVKTESVRELEMMKRAALEGINNALRRNFTVKISSQIAGMF